MDFTIIQGNIAEQAADCLVTAAGTSPAMGNGMAGTLRDAAPDRSMRRPWHRGRAARCATADLVASRHLPGDEKIRPAGRIDGVV